MNKEGILLPESIDSQLVKAKVIFELEKPIWSEVAPNSDHLILHIDTVRANVQLNDPSSAPFIKEIADRFKLQIGEVKQYRDSVLGNNEPSANPIKDIDNNSEAKAKLLQDLGIEVSGGEVEQNQFRLDTNYPFCFVMTYNGPNKGFWEAAGLEGKPIDFLRGMQFPALGNNNLIKK